MKQPHPRAVRVADTLQSRWVPGAVRRALLTRVPALAEVEQARAKVATNQLYLVGVAFEIVMDEYRRVQEELHTGLEDLLRTAAARH